MTARIKVHVGRRPITRACFIARRPLPTPRTGMLTAKSKPALQVIKDSAENYTLGRQLGKLQQTFFTWIAKILASH